MTKDEEIALAIWCALAPDAPDLDELDLWQGFLYRDELRRAVAAGGQLSEDQRASLDAADELFDRAVAEVLPLLHHRGWVDRRPADHYARTYVARHEGEGQG